jgi:hypothetical protein
LRHCKYLIKGSSPGFPPNFGGDYGSVTVIVFTALAWRLLLCRTSVLKDQKIADMRAGFIERTGHYRFYSNIENALQWVGRLRSLGQELDNAPLIWIAKMLDPDPTCRPTAHALVDMILNEDPEDLGISASFCGTCCNTDPGSSAGAESDGEAWIEETARSGPSVIPPA